MGCCSGRSNNDGSAKWSLNEDNVKKVKAALATTYKADDFKAFFADGWRLHHTFKEGDVSRTWLSLVLRSDKKELMESEWLTVDQASLVEEKNYEIFFANEAYLTQVDKNYKADSYGFEATNEDFLKAFAAAELAAKDKELFTRLRAYFGLKAPEVVVPKEEPKKETPVTKKEEDKKEPEKVSE